jgi:hypothetical protein
MRARFASLRLLPWLVLALGFAFGCSGLTGSRDPENVPSAKLTAESRINKPMADSLAAAFAAPPVNPAAKPINALAVSAGGQYVAFDAGLLVAWSEAGTRPEFDIVTGVSSGAIVGIYAFLGKKYDPGLAHLFTTAQDSDFYKYRPFRSLHRTQSLAGSEILEALVQREVTDEALCDLRAAHMAGRRLYIATMNVRTRRSSIWDIGAIACSGRPDADALVRKVIVAAESIPGVLPAVKFDVVVDGCHYCEEHVDGGPATQIFLRPGPGSQKTQNAGWLKGSNFYAMAGGKMYAPELSGKLGFIKRVTTVLSASLYALYRAELMNLYTFCQTSGMTFHSIAIPQDAEVPPNSTTFNPEAEKKLYAMGYKMACPAIPWRLTAPGTEPGEEEAPRGAEQLAPACVK